MDMSDHEDEYLVQQCIKCKEEFQRGSRIYGLPFERIGLVGKCFEEPFREDAEYGSVYYCKKCAKAYEKDHEEKENNLMEILTSECDSIRCMECGDFINDKVSGSQIGVLKFERGYPGDMHEPPEPGYLYFVCMDCYKKTE